LNASAEESGDGSFARTAASERDAGNDDVESVLGTKAELRMGVD
jgi:hypothetical protein